MKVIIVGTGDMRVAQGDVRLMTVGLGSCVGVAMYDPSKKVGGLLHFALPSPISESGGFGESPFLFGEVGVRMLFESLLSLGVAKESIKVKAAGGSDLIGSFGRFSLGKRNILQLRRTLWELGLFMDGKDFGGSVGRNMVLDLSKGEVEVEYPGWKKVIL